jgi:hypothetical protein
MNCVKNILMVILMINHICRTKNGPHGWMKVEEGFYELRQVSAATHQRVRIWIKESWRGKKRLVLDVRFMFDETLIFDLPIIVKEGGWIKSVINDYGNSKR